MKEPSQKDRIEGPTKRQAFNLLHLVVNAHWACIVVFLHFGFGSEALGWSGLYGLFLLLAVAGGTGDPVMWLFAIVWFALLLFHRINGYRLASTGRVCHSQYWGTPWLTVIPGLRDERRALAFEVLLCLVGGALLLPVSQALGAFVMAGAFSMGATLALHQELMRRRVQQMHDAEIEQRAVIAERNRNSFGG